MGKIPNENKLVYAINILTVIVLLSLVNKCHFFDDDNVNVNGIQSIKRIYTRLKRISLENPNCIHLHFGIQLSIAVCSFYKK